MAIFTSSIIYLLFSKRSFGQSASFIYDKLLLLTLYTEAVKAQQTFHMKGVDYWINSHCALVNSDIKTGRFHPWLLWYFFTHQRMFAMKMRVVIQGCLCIKWKKKTENKSSCKNKSHVYETTGQMNSEKKNNSMSINWSRRISPVRD